MTYEDMFVKAILAVFNSLGVTVAIWVFVITMIVFGLLDLYETMIYRKKMPELIAKEILKVLDKFPDNWDS